MDTLKELNAKRDLLDKQIKEQEDKLINENQVKVLEKINSFSEEQIQFILSLLNHGRTSCSDEMPVNGFIDSYDGVRWRCNKCMLMEILSGRHGGEYDFQFHVDIFKVDANWSEL